MQGLAEAEDIFGYLPAVAVAPALFSTSRRTFPKRLAKVGIV
jgi:hypothetical protein